MEITPDILYFSISNCLILIYGSKLKVRVARESGSLGLVAGVVSKNLHKNGGLLCSLSR